MKILKILLLVCTIFVLGTLPMKAASFPFTDVKTTDSHYPAIYSLYMDGNLESVTSNLFKPYDDITRGEAAVVVANVLNLDTKNVTNPNFTDVPTNSEYYGAIAALVENNIVDGYIDKTFKPNNTLTRSQIAKILTLGFDLTVSTSTTSKFSDVNKMKDLDGRRYIQTLVEYKITVGTSTTTFSPYVKLKRGQLATFVYRALQNSGEELEVVEVY